LRLRIDMPPSYVPLALIPINYLIKTNKDEDRQ
jgi:hypothetical protein